MNDAYGTGATPPSRHIYFFYLTNHPDRTRAYFIKRDKPVSKKGGDEEDKIEDVIKIVLDQVKRGLTPIGKGFGAFEFVHKSYFVAVMDDKDEILDPNNAVQFQYGGTGHSNKSFKNGEDIQRFDNITGFYCFNYMKHSKTGNELGDESDNFTVRAYHRARGSEGKGMATSKNEHADTGTNTGPPLE